jgi:hypothetical protein
MHLCLRATVSKCIYLSLLDASPPASPFTTTFTLTTTVTLPCIFLHKHTTTTTTTTFTMGGTGGTDETRTQAEQKMTVAHHQYALPKQHLGGAVVHCIASLPATLSIASSCTTNESSRVTLRT